MLGELLAAFPPAIHVLSMTFAANSLSATHNLKDSVGLIHAKSCGTCLVDIQLFFQLQMYTLRQCQHCPALPAKLQD